MGEACTAVHHPEELDMPRCDGGFVPETSDGTANDLFVVSVTLYNYSPTQVHFRATPTRHPLGMGAPGDSVGANGVSSKPNNKGKEWSMPHEIWSAEEVNNIQARAWRCKAVGGDH